MSASFYDWCVAAAELSLHGYLIFQLEHDDSHFPQLARLHLAHVFDQKALAWNNYCSGMTSTFASCSQAVTDELSAQRAKLNPQFVHFVKERQENLATVQDLKTILSAELGARNTNVTWIVSAIDSMEQRLDADLVDARALTSEAHAAVVGKLESLVQKLGCALEKPC